MKFTGSVKWLNIEVHYPALPNSTCWILHMTEPCTHLPRWSFCAKRRNKKCDFLTGSSSPEEAGVRRPRSDNFCLFIQQFRRRTLTFGHWLKVFLPVPEVFALFWINVPPTYVNTVVIRALVVGLSGVTRIYIQQDFMLTWWIAKVWCNFMSWWWPEISASRCQQRS